jgi:cation diffusion facilitator CzcD-associated flavoprotein CzcO
VPVENFRPLRVIVIGAGFSGIYLSIRFPELLRNVEFVVYEKNPGVGGTWWENRYPGCACDIPGKCCDPDPGSGGDNFGGCVADGWCSVLPAHSYVYTFEPNPEWSSFYAGSAEIQGYLQKVADKYSAGRFIKLSHKVTGCVWDSQKLKW